MFTNEPAYSHEDIRRYVKEGRRLRAAMWITLVRRTRKSLRDAVRRSGGIAINAARRLTKAIIRAHRRNTTVHTLQALDDGTLKDIGLHRSEIRSAVGELFSEVAPSRLRNPAWMARTEVIQKAGKAAANDERFADTVSGHC